MSHVVADKFLNGSLCFIYISILPVTIEFGIYQVLGKCLLDA